MLVAPRQLSRREHCPLQVGGLGVFALHGVGGRKAGGGGEGDPGVRVLRTLQHRQNTLLQRGGLGILALAAARGGKAARGAECAQVLLAPLPPQHPEHLLLQLCGLCVFALVAVRVSKVARGVEAGLVLPVVGRDPRPPRLGQPVPHRARERLLARAARPPCRAVQLLLVFVGGELRHAREVRQPVLAAAAAAALEGRRVFRAVQADGAPPAGDRSGCGGVHVRMAVAARGLRGQQQVAGFNGDGPLAGPIEDNRPPAVAPRRPCDPAAPPVEVCRRRQPRQNDVRARCDLRTISTCSTAAALCRIGTGLGGRSAASVHAPALAGRVHAVSA